MMHYGNNEQVHNMLFMKHFLKTQNYVYHHYCNVIHSNLKKCFVLEQFNSKYILSDKRTQQR